ncbi:olfactory receptor 52E8-like [Pleurodeles waltl]|uniref:olfactory receptor 52E8-like n=1 Tax=Pleurodeles waltl TaxID=8319 RepID=UPI003709A22A
MLSVNVSGFTPSSLILMGIPGLEDFHIWFAAPLTIMYTVTVLGNCVLLLTINTVTSLHKPMYLFISQLALSDLVLSSSFVPKMLGLFWFNAGEIRFGDCLTQMLFVACTLSVESSIFSAMAFDRYVAVCNPLRYTSILTNELITKIASACLVRAILLVGPLPLLILRLKFCSRFIPHSFCEIMAVAKLSCADIFIISVYSWTVIFILWSMDVFCIALSYLLILRTILVLPYKDRFKAFSTCTSHVCAMSAFYLPIFFSSVLNKLHHSIPLFVQVILANAYLLLPPFINPLIFGVTLKAVQQGGIQLLQKKIAMFPLSPAKK